jgi:hypothetical protein
MNVQSFFNLNVFLFHKKVSQREGNKEISKTRNFICHTTYTVEAA